MLEVILADTMRFERIRRLGEKVDVISAYDGLELTIWPQIPAVVG